MATEGPGAVPSTHWTHALFFFLLFGLPISYAIAFLLGFPAYMFLESRGQLARRWFILGAAIIGGVASLFVPLLDDRGLASIAVGVSIGCLTGILFAALHGPVTVVGSVSSAS